MGFTAPEAGIYHIDMSVETGFSMVDIGKFSMIVLYLTKNGQVMQTSNVVVSGQTINQYQQNESTLNLSTDLNLQPEKWFWPSLERHHMGRYPWPLVFQLL